MFQLIPQVQALRLAPAQGPLKRARPVSAPKKKVAVKKAAPKKPLPSKRVVAKGPMTRAAKAAAPEAKKVGRKRAATSPGPLDGLIVVEIGGGVEAAAARGPLQPTRRIPQVA